jgi:HlyD family secretion protein
MSKGPARRLGTFGEDRPPEAFEQLDSVLRIVTIRSWSLLAVVFLTLASFGVFACVYRVPLKVEGRGIILAKSGGDAPLQHVTAPAAGRLTRVHVHIGDVVDAGQLLAEVDQSDLWDQFDEADAALAGLVEEDEALTRFDKEEGAQRIQALETLEETLNHNLALDERRLDRHQQILVRNRNLRRKELLTDLDEIKSMADADAVESNVGATHARLIEVKANRLEDQTKRRKDQTKRRLDIEKAETKLALLAQRLQRDTRVVSPYPGKVIDVMVTEHALVEKGAPAFLLRPETLIQPHMEAIVFVPAGLGKRVSLMDKVEVSPDTVRRQEHGFVRGVVTKVSEIPATEAAMLAELKHKNLVSSFAGQFTGQVLLYIHVDLGENPDARDGGGAVVDGVANPLAWSSSSGARQRVTTGTLCAAAIVVERTPLIALAFPWVKKLVEIY